MCVAMPGMVVEIVDSAKRMGRVEIIGTPRPVNLGILDKVAPGEWMLVQCGLAVETIDAEAGRQAMRLLEELRAAFELELAPMIGGESEKRYRWPQEQEVMLKTPA